MTGTAPLPASAQPEDVQHDDHDAQLMRNLNTAIVAKNERNDQELEDMANGR